jgi:hypothetical protein
MADTRIRHAVDLEQGVAVVIRKGQDGARTVVFEAASDVRHTRRSERRGNRVARMPLIFAAFESEAQRGRAVQPFSRMRVEPMHHGAAPGFDEAAAGGDPGAAGNPWRTASAGYVAMTTSRVVSRRTTNQKPEAMWHHHSYLAPGEPERLNT